jgi:uncharacterized protein YjiS (DUF1127 family)
MPETKLDLSGVDFLSMSPDQQHELVRKVIHEAKAMRKRCIRDAALALLRWPWNAVCHAAAALGGWRQRVRAAAALHALTDHELRDIGIHRSEIAPAASRGRP